MKPLSFCLFFLFACEQPSRFAPLAIETSRPSRTLPAEQWLATTQPTGPLPQVTAPSLTCLGVDESGQTKLPPFLAGQSLGEYRDAIACLITLQNKNYTQARLQLHAGEEIATLEERTLEDTTSYLFWIPGSSWREFIAEKKNFSIEVVFPCEEPDDNEGMGCELVLTQSFAVSTIAPETLTEPKTIKGTAPKVTEPQCATVNNAGLWSEIIGAESTLSPEIFCRLSVENPGETKMENVTLQLRAGTSKTNFKVLSSYFFAELQPKEKREYLFRTPLATTGNTVLISAAAGRNANERNASVKSLSIKIVASSQ
jgi:hypothetical protein